MWLMSETVIELPHCTGDTCPLHLVGKAGKKGKGSKGKVKGKVRQGEGEREGREREGIMGKGRKGKGRKGKGRKGKGRHNGKGRERYDRRESSLFAYQTQPGARKQCQVWSR